MMYKPALKSINELDYIDLHLQSAQDANYTEYSQWKWMVIMWMHPCEPLTYLHNGLLC